MTAPKRNKTAEPKPRGLRVRVRDWTREEALAAQRIDLHGVAAIAQVKVATVKRWRYNYLGALREAADTGNPPVFDNNCLCAPRQELAMGGAWAPADVVKWLIRTKRLARDKETQLRLVSPGRPPGSTVRHDSGDMPLAA